MSVLLKILDKQSILKDYATEFVYACLGSFIIALSAPLTVPLSFTVVPITVQGHIALLVAFLLGRKAGPLAVGLFLLQGIIGYPVFAGGAFGLANFLGPRGGYLVGYFIAALVMGSYKSKTLPQIFSAFGIGNLVVYLFGFVWLSFFIGIVKAFTLGILPFLFGDFIKLVCISKLVFHVREKFSTR